MDDKDREKDDEDKDISVESRGDAWPIVSNPNNYDVKEDGENVGHTPAWDDEQAQEKAESGDYTPNDADEDDDDDDDEDSEEESDDDSDDDE